VPPGGKHGNIPILAADKLTNAEAMKYLSILPTLLFSLLLHAQPSALVKSALDQLQLKYADCHADFIAEKRLPGTSGESVIVIPKLLPADEVYEFSLDCYVLIVDNATGKIRNKYYESNAWQSGVEILTEITIDTAPYLLQEKTRAFGIRVKYTGESRPNPYNTENLTLFVREGDQLKPVLKNFETRLFTGEWDTDCAGEFTEEQSILLMAKTQTNGYFDLHVRSKITITRNYLDEHEDCQESATATKAESMLKFQHGKYVLVK
jgi:hypothetical protein